MKTALITGITGQDGRYLSELLLSKNYKVHGIIRRSSHPNTMRVAQFMSNPNFKLHYGDVTDIVGLITVLNLIKSENPEVIEVYHLAAQSHVKISFEMPIYTANADATGTLNVLEAIRQTGLAGKARMYNATTSELFGGSIDDSTKILNESTPFYPKSPYGCAKLYSFWIVKNYRESYNMFACNGLLFNHTSPYRGINFSERKITVGVGKIVRGEDDKLVMGNIDAMRDWGHAKDYVKAMWLMLQQETPDDFAISTGKCYSVRQFIEMAFGNAGITIKWKGSGINEIGYDVATGRELVFISEKYFRPAEVDILIGDSSKARNKLGWSPEYDLSMICKEMVEHDLVKREL